MRRAGVFNDVLQFLSLLYATRHKSGGSPTHRETLDEAAKDGRNGHRSSASGEEFRKCGMEWERDKAEILML